MHVHRQLDDLPKLRRPVLTIGSFDGVHLGHQALLSRIVSEARAIDGESVLVTFDPHPRHVLAKANAAPLKLLTTTAEKIDRLRALGLDHVVIVSFDRAFAAQTAEEYLRNFLFGKFSPHTVVIGYDHRFGAGRTGDIGLLRQVAQEGGIVVDEIAAQDIERIAVSSTRIRTAVSDGDVETAARLLGSPYPLTGRIVHGQAIGRTIGFPTANLDIANAHKLLPADGVYAVRAHLRESDESHIAMLYVGERPSLAGKLPRSVEVNILDFDRDVYGELMQVDLVARVREDETFDSLDALRQQIERDRERTRAIFAEA